MPKFATAVSTGKAPLKIEDTIALYTALCAVGSSAMTHSSTVKNPNSPTLVIRDLQDVRVFADHLWALRARVASSSSTSSWSKSSLQSPRSSGSPSFEQKEKNE